MPETRTTQLKFLEEKKNSVRYASENAKDVVSSVYIMKAELDKPWRSNRAWPEKIKLTLEWE